MVPAQRIMTGKKSSGEKRCKRCGPEPGEPRKRRRTLKKQPGGSGSVPQEAKCLLPTLDKELFLAEPRDLEEGGLDLTASLKPVSFYLSDRKEMLQQCFCILGGKKLQNVLPDVFKNCLVEEIKKLCQEQLDLLSERKILKILEGDNGLDSDMEEEADGGSKKGSDVVRQRDIGMGSSSSPKENKQAEGLGLKQGKGEDSDREGPCSDEAAAPEVPENTVQSAAGQIDDLEKDIERNVNEILGLAELSPKEPRAATSTVPPTEDARPSAQQLELLELEMRARAIKALIKASLVISFEPES